jgi:hypothetical protein
MRLETSTEADLPIIDAWCANEPYLSRCIYNIAFLTASPNSILVFKLCDQIGPVLFCRIEPDAKDKEIARFHILFAPAEAVSRGRIAKAMLRTMNVVFNWVKAEGYTGIIFDSVSDGLIKFLNRVGFKPVEGTNDYLLHFDPPVILASVPTMPLGL